MFANKSDHQQVNLLNDIILNVSTYFFPNKVITCDDSDSPWINNNKETTKSKEKIVYLKIIKEMAKNPEKYKLLTKATSENSQSIEKSKDKYYYQFEKQLNDPNTSAKSYWTILITFYNKRKHPLIPLLLVNNSSVTDFKEKAHLFNEFFRKQCMPVANNSTLPTLLKTPNEFLSSLLKL